MWVFPFSLLYLLLCTFKMFNIFCTYLLFAKVLAEEDSLFEDFNDTFALSGNISNEAINISNVTLESITKPLEIHVETKIDNSQLIEFLPNISNASKDKRDFKPSLQIETYYEYPIPPTLPEAKRSIGFSSAIPEMYSWEEKLLQTTESPWNTKIKFPTQKPTISTSNDHPYPFVKYDSVSEKNGGVTTYESITINNPSDRPYYGFSSPSDTFQKGHFSVFDKQFQRPISYELQEKPSVLSSIRWNKVVKFLTAAIPIGLLISALTPNIINISPVNVTQNRARLEENESRTKMQLIYSSKLAGEYQRKGCERRILCELLLSAGLSKNGEEYAQNFLDLFVKQGSNVEEKTKELKKMLGAVKKGNCKEFHCESRKKHAN